jgi:amino acid permease
MPCQVAEEIEEIISCDRKMIQTYIRIYVVVGLMVIATLVYLRSQPAVDKIATSLITALVGSIAIPVVFMHLKRKNALTPCTVMHVRAVKCSPEDPECSKLKDWIDQELKRRSGES